MQLNKTFSPADADLTGFASNVTGASFTLTANDAGDGFAHTVTIRNDSATDHSGKTVTLVGTDIYGNTLTEVVTGPAAGATVTSTEFFLTLESATPSATIGADTFDIGWSSNSLMSPIMTNWRGGPASTRIEVSGTIDYDVEMTNSDIQNGDTPIWFIDDTTTQDGATASQTIFMDMMPRAFRLIVNSSTSASFTIDLVQADV